MVASAEKVNVCCGPHVRCAVVGRPGTILPNAPEQTSQRAGPLSSSAAADGSTARTRTAGGYAAGRRVRMTFTPSHPLLRRVLGNRRRHA